MKFNVPSKTLYSFVSAVSKVINSKNALTVLNNFLFTLEDNKLTIKASDTENSLLATLDVTEAEGNGSFCLDARRMVDLLKEMPDQGMTFIINDDTLETVIEYPNGVYHTAAIPGADYPATAQEESEAALDFDITAEQALRGIENTIFAVGNDDFHPQMMGILWDVKPDMVVFVATDTRKLVRYTDKSIATGACGSFILPLKPATVLRTVFGKEENIHVTVTKKSVCFKSANYKFDCRQIKGSFPDYNRVIPLSNPNILTVDRLSLINAVRRVTVFGNDGNGLIKFTLSDNSLLLTAQDSGSGTSGRESLSCEYDGKDMVIGFSSPYLLEIFSTIQAPDVEMKLADPSRPAVCVPTEQEPDTELLMILMPMNIANY
ncbi:MAG: DNA polymerase III subunit beta [Muribaculaceae bacterium]|nr:DNA polymerase III subunit beta [Muribaculaceae bacterium]